MWSRHLIRFSNNRWMSTSVATNVKNIMGWWDHVLPAPKDPITSVTEAFLSDPSPLKLNLGVGAYRDDEGKPVTLECVRRAAESISGCEFLESTKATTKSKFVQDSVKLAYGNDSNVVREGRFAGVPALSGTGACRLFAQFQRRFYPDSQIFLPTPTWSNHHDIWRDSQVCTSTYHYYDPDTKGLQFQALMNDIKNAPDRSFFLLHPCAHNPTGVDPNYEQWKEISHICKIKNHFPFFDMAYQGIASGDLERDATAIRIFLEDGHLLGCAQSFSKNMGLYGHRVGCVSIVSRDEKQATAIKSQLQQIVRAMYSSSPVHGPLLVSAILNDADLKALWEEEVKVMVDRLIRMRITLRRNLEEVNSSASWEHITKQVGMFYFSGLSPKEVDQLQRDFHIYMTNDGRISMAGVTSSNVDYLANAIHEVTNCK
ncbi:aspartate aminotransferase, mitochondrial-like [Lycium barbarum]|uniref:aspartate aminotransferase, mitochondrial-like n=1 Tax=Lycium barbarum TaxID=112863 RepID=UPI00293F02FF|nr:aspartate aminotransferase, mitochondrial-like [Lycium barbarum]